MTENLKLNLAKGIVTAVILAIAILLSLTISKNNVTASNVEVITPEIANTLHDAKNANEIYIITPEIASKLHDAGSLTEEDILEMNIRAREGRPQAEKK